VSQFEPAHDVLQFRSYSSDDQVQPAMAACITIKLWELADMVEVLEDWEGR
jgi:hypothetical protein